MLLINWETKTLKTSSLSMFIDGAEPNIITKSDNPACYNEFSVRESSDLLVIISWFDACLNINYQISIIILRNIILQTIYHRITYREDLEKIFMIYLNKKSHPHAYVTSSGIWDKFEIWNCTNKRKGLRLILKNTVAHNTRSSPSFKRCMILLLKLLFL